VGSTALFWSSKSIIIEIKEHGCASGINMLVIVNYYSDDRVVMHRINVYGSLTGL
jgi:hypothetical protein